MGQEICALLVPGHRNIKKEIVHFFEDGLTIVPVPPMLYRDSVFSLNAFLSHLVAASCVEVALESSREVAVGSDEDGELLEDFSDLATLITNAAEGTFSLEYYTEWADLPVEHLFVTAVAGRVVKSACVLWREEGKYDRLLQDETHEAFQHLFGLKSSWLANERRYFRYEDAEREYAATTAQSGN